jgi:hypothetical protein
VTDALPTSPIKAQLALSDAEAWALAQLVKRIGWSDCRALAVDDAEARLMIQATDRVRAALAAGGYAPR